MATTLGRSVLFAAASAAMAVGCSVLVSLDGLAEPGDPRTSNDAGDAPSRDVSSGSDAGDGSVPSEDGAAALPSPLLYYYAFGDVKDSSGRGLDGTLVGNARVDAPGARGNGLSCSGVEPDSFRFGSLLTPGKSSFTLAFFYRLATASVTGPNAGLNTLVANGCAFENSDCGERGFGVGVAAGSPALVGFVSDGTVKARWFAVWWRDPQVANSTIHHAAFVVDRAAAKISLFGDGALRDSSALPSDFGSVDSKGMATLCSEGDPRWTLNGMMDEVMVFGKPLTNTEILALSQRR